jgi:opacity protein-like surface antigen
MELDQFDNKLKDKFQNFEVQPPEHLWDAIQSSVNDTPTDGGSSAASTSGGSSGTDNIIKLISGIIIVGAITTYVLFSQLSNKEESDTPQTNNIELIEKSQDVTLSTNSEDEDNNKAITLNSEPTFEIRQLVVPQNKKQKSTKVLLKIPNKIEGIEAPISNITYSDTKLSLTNNSSPEQLLSAESYNDRNTNLAFIQPNLQDLDMEDYYKELHIIKNLTQYLNLNKYDKSLASIDPGSMVLGVFVSPERIFFKDQVYDNIDAISFDLEGKYQISENSFIQSGLNLNQSSEKADYSLYHRTYDQVDSYQDVYDVQFEIVDGVPVPTYFTEEVAVYDSVVHQLDTKANNKYTYLQIPLTYGYNIDYNSRFSYSLRTGPVFSFLINEKQELDIDESEYVLTGPPVDNTPLHVNTNVQFLVALGLNYEVTDNLSLQLEPRYKYYINEVYSNGPTSVKPSSLGVRFGLFYKLNNK